MKNRKTENKNVEKIPGKADILVVDDNLANQTFLTDLITTFGHIPRSALNGIEALEQVDHTVPDIILLDIMMPKMDGFEVLQHLNQKGLIEKIPVIVISALDDMQSIVRCIKQGAADYLVKPFHAVILKARIQNCLEKKFRLDQEKILHKNLEKSYDTLKELENARNSLASMIVHDLNNPLSTVKGYTQYLSMKIRKTTLSPQEILTNLRKISNAASDMEELIKGILDVSKLEADRMEIHESIFNAVDLSKDIFDRFIIQKGENRKFEFSSTHENIEIKTDKALLSRVIQNLISNAIKHSKSSTSILIDIEKNENYIIIKVKDNGYGIPEHHLPKIFEKFIQLESKKIGRKYGVGLGLYFCKMAIEAMNGKIWAESKLDDGSTFFIELPLHNKDQE